jgi:hypothetical protein
MPSMDAPEKLIENSERLASIFGYWPSFHDAEVIKFDLWRGDVQPEENRYVFPYSSISIFEVPLRYFATIVTVTTCRSRPTPDQLNSPSFESPGSPTAARPRARTKLLPEIIYGC